MDAGGHATNGRFRETLAGEMIVGDSADDDLGRVGFLSGRTTLGDQGRDPTGDDEEAACGDHRRHHGRGNASGCLNATSLLDRHRNRAASHHGARDGSAKSRTPAGHICLCGSRTNWRAHKASSVILFDKSNRTDIFGTR